MMMMMMMMMMTMTMMTKGLCARVGGGAAVGLVHEQYLAFSWQYCNDLVATGHIVTALGGQRTITIDLATAVTRPKVPIPRCVGVGLASWRWDKTFCAVCQPQAHPAVRRMQHQHQLLSI